MNRGEFSNSPEKHAEVVQDVLLDAIRRKFTEYPEHVGTFTAVTGQIFETLELGTASLRREMLPDGRRGAPDIEYERTNITGSMGWNERIELNEEGKWVYVFSDDDIGGSHQAGDKISPFRKGVVLARVIAGRPKRVRS